VQHSLLIHSVDSLKLLNRIQSIAETNNKTQQILLQANVSGESSKSGFSLNELPDLLHHAMACNAVHVSGFMTMAPFQANTEELTHIFTALRNFRDLISKKLNMNLPELSMGMSRDYIPAIRSGATIIRVGTAIFGNRPPLL